MCLVVEGCDADLLDDTPIFCAAISHHMSTAGGHFGQHIIMHASMILPFQAFIFKDQVLVLFKMGVLSLGSF